ncbi:MAG TPA: glycosyltransferase [Acidimicrobiales bacterium]|nr:glycosyltransferase [Acidimicrobiales bacterium]
MVITAETLTAVIVHRRQPEACVRTGRLLLEEGVDRLIVVDNGSGPEALAAVVAGLPAAEVIDLGANAGFGPGANAGVRRWLDEGPSAGEWVLVCPHDATPEPGCVATLVKAAEARPRAGLACAEYGDHHEPKARPVVDPYLGGILVATDRRPGWEDAGHPHGTMLLARRACLEEVGLFDERYFAYCEEADLGMRAREAGWEVGIVWGAIVRNPTMSSETGVPEYLMLRNTLLLLREHFGVRHAAFLYLIAVLFTVRGVLGGRKTLYWDLRGRLFALRDAPLGRVGPPPAALLRS